VEKPLSGLLIDILSKSYNKEEVNRMEVNPTRYFNLTYITIDSVFCLVLLSLLFIKKKRICAYWSLAGGVLYFLVDFGYFYLLSGSRRIFIDGTEQGITGTALVLLWMSLSYGLTNFAYIWLCLDEDGSLKEWLTLIIGWWLVAPVIAAAGGERNIETTRTTNQYHWIMAVILAIGYFYLIVRNLTFKNKEKADILKLNLIGISVQFCWEAALLINRIRPAEADSLLTLFVDSLIETNLGMPYIWFIHTWVTRRWNEDTSKKEASL
jgi:hypothetical protein